MKKDPSGHLCLILHAHLPYIRHPEHNFFLEETWLYEAMTETYLPLLGVIENILQDNIDFKITISLSPTLIEMLNDPLLRSRYINHLNGLIELSEKEVWRLRKDSVFGPLAKMYRRDFKRLLRLYEEHYKRDIVGAFRDIQKSGNIEIITTSATHGFLPNLSVNPETVRAQVFIAVECYKRNFGGRPSGMWLPECGYYPGLDDILKEAGIKYFFVETHGLLYGNPFPKYGTYLPVYCPSGVAAFGRDTDSSKEVWSSVEGYPGDYNYREFYRDIGFDLPYKYIRPHIHPDGIRINTGIKYYRITGNTTEKKPYIRNNAIQKARKHANIFIANREQQTKRISDLLNINPLIVAPYDAELFGHWWYEGLQWLNFLLRKTAHNSKIIKLITPSEYLSSNNGLQVVMPNQSSWGWKGYSESWLNNDNEWIYPLLHRAAQRMTELARENPEAKGLQLRAVKQGARELLLAQSSDWAFIMRAQTAVGYAQKRVMEHLHRFNTLYRGIKENMINEEFLADIEKKDNIFQEIDYRIYS